MLRQQENEIEHQQNQDSTQSYSENGAPKAVSLAICSECKNYFCFNVRSKCSIRGMGGCKRFIKHWSTQGGGSTVESLAKPRRKPAMEDDKEKEGIMNYREKINRESEGSQPATHGSLTSRKLIENALWATACLQSGREGEGSWGKLKGGQRNETEEISHSHLLSVCVSTTPTKLVKNLKMNCGRKTSSKTNNCFRSGSRPIKQNHVLNARWSPSLNLWFRAGAKFARYKCERLSISGEESDRWRVR